VANEKTNYNKALELLNMGRAQKHYSYDDTGIITIDLDGNRCGYADPNKSYIEITYGNTLVWYGNISDDKKTITGTRHNRSANIL
jgi:hypothetical protein